MPGTQVNVKHKMNMSCTYTNDIEEEIERFHSRAS